MYARWEDSEVPAGSSLFPIDVAPGRAISLPVSLRAPNIDGRTKLRLTLDLDGAAVVRVGEWALDVGESKVESQLQRHAHISDYGEDHQAAVSMLSAYLRGTGKHMGRILEVGCGSHPQLAWMDGFDVVGLDISGPLLELGSLFFEGRFESRFGLVCADAFNPPFAAASFDVIAMFAALHHFPNPAAFLNRLSGLLSPGGVIAVMCEPLGSSLETAPTVRDLLKGINEQVFSWREYELIFRRAGLGIAAARADGDSLKAILVKAPPTNEVGSSVAI